MSHLPVFILQLRKALLDRPFALLRGLFRGFLNGKRSVPTAIAYWYFRRHPSTCLDNVQGLRLCKESSIDAQQFTAPFQMGQKITITSEWRENYQRMIELFWHHFDVIVMFRSWIDKKFTCRAKFHSLIFPYLDLQYSRLGVRFTRAVLALFVLQGVVYTGVLLRRLKGSWLQARSTNR